MFNYEQEMKRQEQAMKEKARPIRSPKRGTPIIKYAKSGQYIIGRPVKRERGLAMKTTVKEVTVKEAGTYYDWSQREWM